MARIRTIKPSFFTDPDIATLSLSARLTYIGLWTHADDAGRAVDDARLIKAALWPLDDRHTPKKVEADLLALAAQGHIRRYEHEGRRYLAVVHWHHQRISHPQASILPDPGAFTEHSVNGHGKITEPSAENVVGSGSGSGSGKDLEGKGKTPTSSSDSRRARTNGSPARMGARPRPVSDFEHSEHRGNGRG